MRKLLLMVTALTLSFGLASCGGGGGSGSVSMSSPSGVENSSTVESRSIDGGVYSSYVANAEVCLEDPSGNILTDSNGDQLCSTTRSDGVFQLQLPAGFSLSNDDLVGLYVKTSDDSTIKIAEAPVSQLEVDNNTDTIAIAPLPIAENDQNLANTIGALIHALGGDTTGNADVVVLGNVEVSNLELVNQNGQAHPVLLNGNTSLEDLLKERKELRLQVYQGQLGQSYQITVNPNNSTAPVSVNLNGMLAKIAYNCQTHQEEFEEHLKALEALSSGNVSEYLQAKTVALLLSLNHFLSHILNSTFVSDNDKQAIQELIDTTIPSLINSINKNGLNADNLSNIDNLISQLQTLASDLQSVSAGFKPAMLAVHLENTVSILESIEMNVENAQSSQIEQQVAGGNTTSPSELTLENIEESAETAHSSHTEHQTIIEDTTGSSENTQASNTSSAQSTSEAVQQTTTSTSVESSNTSSSENTTESTSTATTQSSSEETTNTAGS